LLSNCTALLLLFVCVLPVFVSWFRRLSANCNKHILTVREAPHTAVRRWAVAGSASA